MPALTSSAGKALPAFAGHAWLAAVVPADARRFRVRDANLAYTLRVAGAELVESGAEVEIAMGVQDLSGTAPVAIVVLNDRLADSPSRLRQVKRRMLASGAARSRAAAVRLALQRSGYHDVAVLPWDLEQTIRISASRVSRRATLAALFPRRIVVVGRRGERRPSALEHGVEQAAAHAGTVTLSQPLLRAGALVMLSEHGVLRITLGPAARQIQEQARVLDFLAGSLSAPAVVERTPTLLATGEAGLARWSLEERLPGKTAPEDLDGPLLRECVDFLVDLHGLGDPGAVGSLTAGVEAAAPALSGRAAVLLHRLARRIDEQVAGIPGGFFHGDFWAGNILVREGRVSGIVDWEGASSSGLPLLDLLHLRLLTSTQASIYRWGRAIVDYLLPLARAGGDAVTNGYLRRLAIEPRARRLEALVAAYWLDRVSYQLSTYRDRAADADWIRLNVEDVLSALVGTSSWASVD